jgi:uncharacterized protein YndB with AHSA1/START domain
MMALNGQKTLTITGNPACGYVLIWKEANGTPTCTRHCMEVPARIKATAQREGYAIVERAVSWETLTSPYEG